METALMYDDFNMMQYCIMGCSPRLENVLNRAIKLGAENCIRQLISQDTRAVINVSDLRYFLEKPFNKENSELIKLISDNSNLEMSDIMTYILTEGIKYDLLYIRHLFSTGAHLDCSYSIFIEDIEVLKISSEYIDYKEHPDIILACIMMRYNASLKYLLSIGVSNKKALRYSYIAKNDAAMKLVYVEKEKKCTIL